MKNKPFWKKAAALLCAVCLLMSLAACGGEEETAPASYVDGEQFVVAVAQTPESVNPAVTADALAAEFYLLCYDPLWRTDENGEPVACLVDSYSLSSDKLTWTIRLRQDVTFSDGVGLTAEDVLFTYDMMRHYSDAYAGYFDGVTDIRCPDAYTVVISTSYVKGDMMENPTPILPKHLWNGYEFNPAEFDNAAMVGTGPFVYDAAASGETGWVFRAREDYFGGAANIGSVFFASYGTVTGAARAVAAGEVDASFGLTDVQLTTLENVPGVELIEALTPSASVRAAAFNLREDSLFANATLRQVLELCMDRAWFLSMASGGAGMTGSSFASPGADYFAAISGLRSYDTASAATLLRTLGYADADEDGVLEYGTEDDELTMTLYTSNLDDWASTAAAILTEELTGLGVSVNWKKTDLAVSEACTAQTDWDVCMISWNGSASAVLAAAAFSENIAALTGWSSSQYDSGLTALRSAMEPAQVTALAQQLQQLVYDESPCVVVGYAADVQAIRSDLWTGYEELLAQCGGLFGIGTDAVYMKLAPIQQS